MKKIVFIGPTITIDEAKTLLPDAMYLPPARSGDVLRAVRLKPDIIAIIDGVFERTASVWHKEILFALEKGIQVFGSSSMGALRARELSDFGMLGVGDVFQAYRDSLNEDDAVAVLHGSAGANFSAETIAYVNLKATLDKALQENILDQMTAHIIEIALKDLFYPFRLWETILQKATNAGADARVLLSFANWVKENGWVDVKKQDAVQLLRLMRAAKSSVDIEKSALLSLHRSLFFRTQLKSVMCRPFMTYHEELPFDEKVAAMSRYLGTTYRQTRRLAYLLSACYALAKKFRAELPSNNEFNQEAGREAIKRYTAIQKLLHFNLQNPVTKETKEDYLFGLMRLSLTNEFKLYKKDIQLFQEKEPVKYHLFSLTASLWWLIEQYAAKHQLIPNQFPIYEYSNKFRAKQALFSKESFQEWLLANELSEQEYAHLMMISTRFNYLVLQNNLDALDVIDTEEDVWWFMDALYLSGVYSEAKELVNNPEIARAHIAEYSNYYSNTSQLEHDLDFASSFFF